MMYMAKLLKYYKKVLSLCQIIAEKNICGSNTLLMTSIAQQNLLFY